MLSCGDPFFLRPQRRLPPCENGGPTVPEVQQPQELLLASVLRLRAIGCVWVRSRVLLACGRLAYRNDFLVPMLWPGANDGEGADGSKDNSIGIE